MATSLGRLFLAMSLSRFHLSNLKKMEEETFSKIVMGKADISEFDTFVENWKSQGGDQILTEINEELSK